MVSAVDVDVGVDLASGHLEADMTQELDEELRTRPLLDSVRSEWSCGWPALSCTVAMTILGVIAEG